MGGCVSIAVIVMCGKYSNI